MGTVGTKNKRTPATRSAAVDSPSSVILASGKVERRADFAKLAHLFHKISDPIRLKLLLTMSDGEVSSTEFSSRLGESALAISHHLALLRFGGLVQSRRLGKKNFYALTARGKFAADAIHPIASPFEPLHPIEAKPIDPELLDDMSGFVDDAEEWFYAPNPEFEGRKPIDMLGTKDEARLRNRIKAAVYGMFS